LDLLDKNQAEVNGMTDLGIEVDDVPEQVTEPGELTIKKVNVNQKTRLGSAHQLILTNSKTESILYVQHRDRTTSSTNLGRLVKAFGPDPDRWVGKKIEVTFDKDGKRKIVTVVK
jgi:hypothetical protein